MKVNDISNVQITTDYGWIVSVRFTPWSDRVELWIANRRDGIKTEIYHFNENGEMVASYLKEGSEPLPTMTINRFIWEGIKKSFQNIEEIPEQQALASELKATKYHLEDMRKIVFNPEILSQQSEGEK